VLGAWGGGGCCVGARGGVRVGEHQGGVGRAGRCAGWEGREGRPAS